MWMCVLDIHVGFHYKLQLPMVYKLQSQEICLKINPRMMITLR